MQTLKSEIDDSVNFITKSAVGYTEARYVRRAAHYMIGYLSSQTGCNHGCKFCHLTTTDQKQFTNVDPIGFAEQAKQIMQYYNTKEKARIINWNFMARGEPLANDYITDYSQVTFSRIAETADSDHIQRFNISTIMPIKFKKSLAEAFPVITPTIYYSIYSLNKAFREKWMPAAQPVDQALENLKDYQDVTGKEIKFHSAFIEGENGKFFDLCHMMEKICGEYDIRGSFNIVRYNPYSPEQGKEHSIKSLEQITKIIEDYGMKCNIVTRVGEDVKASCGMFVNG